MKSEVSTFPIVIIYKRPVLQNQKPTTRHNLQTNIDMFVWYIVSCIPFVSP